MHADPPMHAPACMLLSSSQPVSACMLVSRTSSVSTCCKARTGRGVVLCRPCRAGTITVRFKSCGLHAREAGSRLSPSSGNLSQAELRECKALPEAEGGGMCCPAKIRQLHALHRNLEVTTQHGCRRWARCCCSCA